MCSARGVVMLLVGDILNDPGKVPGTETDDAVTGLPVQYLLVADLVIDVVRGGALQLTDPLANQQRRRHADRHVYVVGCAVHGVDENSLRLDGSVGE